MRHLKPLIKNQLSASIVAIVGAVAIGIAIGGTFGHANGDASASLDSPRPTVTVTVKIPVVENYMPQACMSALDKATNVVANVDALTDASNKELDILSAAIRAIQTRNWQDLNKQMALQRQLQTAYSATTNSVLLAIPDLLETLDACRVELSNDGQTREGS